MANFDPFAEYSAGFVGASYNPRADESLESAILRKGGDPDGGSVATSWGFGGLGDGKLSLNFTVVSELYGSTDCFSGAAQRRGDCVSWAARNCGMMALLHEAYNGDADEVTGKVEAAPKVSETGFKNGIFANEPVYMYRGHRGDGWFCHAAAERMIDSAGMVLRQNYDEIGLDLEKYDPSLAGKYYNGAPDQWRETFQAHRIRTATKLSGPEQARDFLAAANCGVMICGGLGWSKTRDENGYARQSGSWAHAQTLIGWDHRPETCEKYGDPEGLCLIQNSWGKWNSGGRRVMGTNVDIPHGSYWAKGSLMRKFSLVAVSGVNGWPIGKLPNYGATGSL